MELKVSVSEALELIPEIEHVPAKLFEYIGMSIRKEVGTFLSNLMGKELTDHIGREEYERKNGATDYRNGSYARAFCIKGIGDVPVSTSQTETAKWLDSTSWPLNVPLVFTRICFA